MIQTGDPTGTGSHDCGFTIKDEVVDTLKFDRPGRLGMANIGSPNTGGCQFFITQKPYPSLDPPTGKYTIFGQVVEGQEVVDKIAVCRRAPGQTDTPVQLVSVTIKREGPPPAPAPAVKKAAPTGTAAKKAAPATTAPAPRRPLRRPRNSNGNGSSAVGIKLKFLPLPPMNSCGNLRGVKGTLVGGRPSDVV